MVLLVIVGKLVLRERNKTLQDLLRLDDDQVYGLVTVTDVF